ncbi:MAG: radical SAM protein [Candidatus Staskawiczbacteria bacterium]|nr:radical SAM protein [Candidatus Staskawiczbacteria bacterium]
MTTKHFEEWHWEITRVCNLRCNHCITDCGSPEKNELSTHEALTVVDRIARLGCEKVMFTGGEPLARKDIVAILEACKAKGMGLRLITNGFTSNRGLVLKLSSLLDLVGVSLDGVKEETHDAVRGAGSFNKACRAISAFSSVLPVSVHITVSAQNIYEVEDIIKKAMALGAYHVHISEIAILGRALAHKSWLALDRDQKVRLRKIAERMTKRQNRLCNPNLSTVYLSFDGLVYPCSEIALKKPKRFLASILSEQCVEELTSLSSSWVIPNETCCYVVYEGDKVTFCLGSDSPCCMIGGGWL